MPVSTSADMPDIPRCLASWGEVGRPGLTYQVRSFLGEQLTGVLSEHSDIMDIFSDASYWEGPVFYMCYGLENN